MFMSIKSRSHIKLGHVGSKARMSEIQILKKTYVHSGRYSFDQIRMNLYQNVCHHEKRTDLKVGHVGSETRLAVDRSI